MKYRFWRVALYWRNGWVVVAGTAMAMCWIVWGVSYHINDPDGVVALLCSYPSILLYSGVALAYAGLAASYLPERLWNKLGKFMWADKKPYPYSQEDREAYRKGARAALEATERAFLYCCNQQEWNREKLKEAATRLREHRAGKHLSYGTHKASWDWNEQMIWNRGEVRIRRELLKYYDSQVEQFRTEFVLRWSLFEMLGITPTNTPRAFLREVIAMIEAEKKLAS